MQKCYDLGVSSFLSKPTTYESLRDLVREITHYWFETVRYYWVKEKTLMARDHGLFQVVTWNLEKV